MFKTETRTKTLVKFCGKFEGVKDITDLTVSSNLGKSIKLVGLIGNSVPLGFSYVTKQELILAFSNSCKKGKNSFNFEGSTEFDWNGGNIQATFD